MDGPKGAPPARWIDLSPLPTWGGARTHDDEAVLRASGLVPAREFGAPRCACGRPAVGSATTPDGAAPACLAVAEGHADAPGPVTRFDPGHVAFCETTFRSCFRVTGDTAWVRPLRLADARSPLGFLACREHELFDRWGHPEVHGRPGSIDQNGEFHIHGPVSRTLGGEAWVGTWETPFGGQEMLGLGEWFELAARYPAMLEVMRRPDPGTQSVDLGRREGRRSVRYIEWGGSRTIVSCECRCGCARHGRAGDMLRESSFQCDPCLEAGHAPLTRSIGRARSWER